MKRLKSLLSILLAAAMLLGLLPMAVMAEEDETAQYPYTYESANGDYVAYKVSHPDSPTNRLGTGDRYADGIVDYVGSGVVVANDQGQGDRAQNYSWSAIQHGDWVYIGTCANAMTSTLQLMGTALGHDFSQEQLYAIADVMYNGDFFLGEEDGGDPAGILVKVNVNTGETVLLMSKATTGFNMQLRNACEYKGKLYFCGSVAGLPSILQIDPETDECKVIYQGMTQMDFYQAIFRIFAPA